MPLFSNKISPERTCEDVFKGSVFFLVFSSALSNLSADDVTRRNIGSYSMEPRKYLGDSPSVMVGVPS